MPTYEYECVKCGHHFDVFQNINAEPLEKCPKCKGKVKRLISSGAGIILKGSGFYATDYRKKDSGKSSDTKPKTGCDACSQKHTCNP